VMERKRPGVRFSIIGGERGPGAVSEQEPAPTIPMSSVIEYSILAVYFVSLLILTIFGMQGLLMVYYFKKHRSLKGLRPKPLPRYPRVTVQLPIFNEFYVVERLIRATCRLDYPRESLEIQVLDDSRDETVVLSRRLVEEYRAQGFNIHWRHREDRQGFKAGALKQGLAQASGEFIAIFDADFVPPRDFLVRTLPFFSYPKIGMVQTRWGHLNADYSLLTRLQAIGLDGHFVVEQAARNGAGFFINFNGTAGIWRTACILDAGGWSDDTLTEDLDLSYRAQLRGWQFKFLHDPACLAELPAEIGALRSQQFRWTKGAIETAKKILPRLWRAEVPWRIKLQGLVHLTNNLVFPFVFLIGLLYPALIYIKNDGLGDYSSYFAISTVFVAAFGGSFLMYLISQKELYLNWRQRILYFPMFLAGSMGLALNNTRAIVQGLFNHKSEFTRTPKYCIESKGDQFLGKKYFESQRALKGRAFKWTNSGLAELALAVYSFAGILLSFYYFEFAAIPFQSLYCFGYGFIGFLSFKQALWPAVRQFFQKEAWFSGRAKQMVPSH
jgi:cellulose synthase/poly-beta-1,6-N-acetylglucosamine synthase-like glycosyltransferase